MFSNLFLVMVNALMAILIVIVLALFVWCALALFWAAAHLARICTRSKRREKELGIRRK